MVSIAEARRTILSAIDPLPGQEVPLLEGLGRIIAEDIHSPFDIPMTDNSAMDGYAFCFAALGGDRLEVQGFLPAGADMPGPVPRGAAIRIMTVAPVPPRFDTVVPFEDTQSLPGGGIRLTGTLRQGAHVRLRGEDVRSGDRVICAGALLRPQEVGMAASLGLSSLKVHQRVQVAILATGEELLEVGATPVPGRIVTSNSFAIASQVMEAGGEPRLLGIARDNMEATKALIREGSQADFLVITGGVSVGDRDYVKDAIEELGGKIVFWKVDMKPGKPVVFAILEGKPIFALPGNPVAAMVGFEMFVRPAILRKMGHSRLLRPVVRAALASAVQNKGERPHLIRALVSLTRGGYEVSITGNQSSANLRSLIASNGLIMLPPQAAMGQGEAVEVILLDRSFEFT